MAFGFSSLKGLDRPRSRKGEHRGEWKTGNGASAQKVFYEIGQQMSDPEIVTCSLNTRTIFSVGPGWHHVGLSPVIWLRLSRSTWSLIFVFSGCQAQAHGTGAIPWWLPPGIQGHVPLWYERWEGDTEGMSSILSC